MKERWRGHRWFFAGIALVAVLVPTSLAVGAEDPEEREMGLLPGPLAGYPLPLWLDPPPAPGGDDGSFEEQVAALINAERWANGQLPPLKQVSSLNTASELHSTNMAVRNFFAHCDPDTNALPWDRMTAAGYIWNAAAENIAAGQSSPAAVVDAWMGSPGHRANILNTAYREIGNGYFLDAVDLGNIRRDLDGNCTVDSVNNGPYSRYWTQNFGRRNNVYPVVIEREAYRVANRNVDLYLYGVGWATEMRLRNESGGFTAWQPFATDVAWTLSSGSGVKVVTAELRNASLTVLSSSDSIVLEDLAPEIFFNGFESGNTNSWSETVGLP